MIDAEGPLDEQEAKDAIAAGESKPWLDMLRDAEKAFQFYQDKCDKIDDLYASLARQANPTRDREFAIFWANIEVLGPSIYARPPVPVVVPRFNSRKPVPNMASQLLERSISVAFEQEHIDQLMRLIRNDLTVNGRGVPWVRYDTTEKEKVCLDHKDRKDFLHEPARNWREVGWVAGAAYLSRDKMRKRFTQKDEDGSYLVDQAEYEIDKDAKKNKATDQTKKAKVWEIWHKGENKVIWVTEGVDRVLEEAPPHLTLDDFFPCPEPAYGTVQRRSLVPVPDMLFYKDQLEEINELTARISALSEALRVRGFYPAGTGEIGDAIEAAINSNDNRKIMVPISNFAAFGNGGAKDSIVWLPIDMVATTITQLVQLRKELIDDVYQITGLSDIMRGSTAASETATAQKLKSQYGSVRVRDKQSEMVRLARDLARIMGEIMAENFSPKTLLDMSQLDIATNADVKKEMDGLTQQIAKMQQDIQSAQQDPHVQQMVQQNPDKAHEVLQQAQGQMQQLQQQIEDLKEKPTLEKCVALLRENRLRPFVLDIETDSTIQPDEDAEKQRRAEFLQALGGTLQQLAPMVQQNPKTASFAGEVLKFALAPFRAGRELEQSIDEFVEQMQQMAPPQQPNGDAMQAQVDQQRVQIEGQRLQFDQQKAQNEFQIRQAEIAANARTAQMQGQADVELEWRKAQLSALTSIEVARIGAKTDTDSQQVSARLEAALQFNDQAHEQTMQAAEQQHEQEMTAADQAHQQDMASQDQAHQQQMAAQQPEPAGAE